MVIVFSVLKSVLVFHFSNKSIYELDTYFMPLVRINVYSNVMQIVTFEDATCVPNIYMHVASGFVCNLLCKRIHSAANRNETLSTI
jgi:hypothetical protein